MNQKVGYHGNDLEEDFYTKYSKKENDVKQEEVELFDDFLFKDNKDNKENDELFQTKSIKEQEKRRQESIEEYMEQMEEFLNRKNTVNNIKNTRNTRNINSYNGYNDGSDINQNVEYYDKDTYVDNYFTNFEQKQKRENRVSDIIMYVFLLIVLLFSVYMIFGNN